MQRNISISSSLKSVFNSSFINGVKDFLKELNAETLYAISQTATNHRICPENTKEAIEAILLYTSDIDRLFSYRPITVDLLKHYLRLNSHDVKKTDTRQHLIAAVKNVWAKKYPDEGSTVIEKEIDSSDSERSENFDVPRTSISPTNIYNIVSSYSERSERCLVPSTSVYSTNINNLPINPIENSVTVRTKNIIRSDEFARRFVTWFYDCVNNFVQLQSCSGENTNVINSSMFFSNASLEGYLVNLSQTIEFKGVGSESCEKALKDVLFSHRLLFSPNLDHGTVALKSTHGLINVCCCGSLHKGNNFIGIFEQEFGLAQCPINRTWKISFTKANLKNAVTELPTLPSLPLFEIEEM